VSQFIPRLVVVALFVYLITLGATFSGIYAPDISLLTLGISGLVLTFWLFSRWRQGWKWHHTPLDTVFLLWVLAFGLSLVANLDAARRIAIGLWYVGVYIGVWYVLQDSLANGALSRDTLVDGLLISGFIIVVIGYWKLQSWLTKFLTLGLSVMLPRPSSVFENPNFLSAFLIVLLPFLFSRIVLAPSRHARILLGIFAVLALLQLFLTYSRAAWLGMAAGTAVWLGLMLAHKGLLSRSALNTWWRRQSRLWHTALLITATLTLLGGAVIIVIFVRSFSETGRTANLRTDIYTAAIELFAEKPITGQGLFTFGRGLVRLPDVQPDRPHSHAHDAVLQIAAELGIIGLMALTATLIIMTRMMRGHWQLMQGRDRLMLAGAIAAVAAFAVDQLGDMPSMMPAIALTGLIALIAALAPVNPKAIQVRWGHYAFPVGVAGLWGILLLTGVWSNRVYSQYVSALKYVIDTNDYLGAANRLQPVVDADPNLSLYWMEQAFLFGMDASKGNLGAADKGIAAYQQFLALDPGYALGWANMAALQWQRGDHEQAIGSIEQAIRLDSNVWQYYLNLAAYAEAEGDIDTANKAHDQILQLYPDASLYPDFNQLALRRQISNVALKFSVPAQVTLLLDAGQAEQGAEVWRQNPQPESTESDFFQVLLALGRQDHASAVKWLARAEILAASTPDAAWVHLGKSRVAQFDNNHEWAVSEAADARNLLMHKPLDADDELSINIAYAQFLRFAIPRLFLPQVNYHINDPVLLHLLAASP
jgi:tetratricopeptide (TPR) repeat protein